MKTKSPRVLVLAAGLALSAMSSSTAAQSTYIGPSQGLWSDPANWSPFGVPDNSLGGSFNVILPASASVMFDMPTPTQITGASFESNSRLDLANASLEILGIALLQKTVIEADGPGTSLLTHAPFVTGDTQRVFVTGGALVDLELSNYIFSIPEWRTTATLLSSDGIGSLLDMSNVALIDVSNTFGSTGTYVYSIRSSNGGTLDLSGVATIKGGSNSDWLRFNAETGGVIDLSGTTSITSGHTWFDLTDDGVVDLSSLATIGSTTKFDVPDFETLDLPSLIFGNNTSFNLSAGGVLNATSMSSANFSTFSLGDGATVNAPLLSDFERSYVRLNSSITWNVPPFTEIDGAQLNVEQGAVLSVVDTDYIFSIPEWNRSATLLSSDGSGSLLDMSGVGIVDVTGTFGSSGNYIFSMLSSNGGVIDLSGVTTLKGGSNSDWLKIHAESGGLIDLSGVDSISGGYIWFDLSGGGSIDLSSLSTVTSTTQFDVAIFETLDLPTLTSARYTTMAVQDGGTVSAPLLTDFRDSTVTITPSRFWNVPAFTMIDRARLNVAQGATLVVADTEYIFNIPEWRRTDTLSTSDGVGSLLDMSSVTILDASGTFGSTGNYIFTVLARNSGTIDISGVEIVRGGSNSDWLRFRSETGGSIELGSMEHISGHFWLDVDGVGSVMTFAGDLILGLAGGTPRISASTLSELHIGGDVVHDITTESWHTTSGGTLFMDGVGSQVFEVAGIDLGLPASNIGDNFNWGTLVVGQDTQATTVVLQDIHDNGNRGAGGEPEVLYLSGLPQGDAGLAIRGGSTLYLNGLQAYVGTVNGWVHINALFGPGQYKIPYDNGFIQLIDCVADVNGDGTLNSADFTAWIAAFNTAAPGCDQNGDGSCTPADFTAWIANFNAGCS